MTYLALADRFGIRLCASCHHHRSHQAGFVAGGQLHWRPRRVYRRGLYRFLKLVWHMRAGGGAQPLWYEIWQANRFASDIALDLGLRLPASFADEDRGRVAYLLQRYGPGTIPVEDVQRARRWTIR